MSTQPVQVIEPGRLTQGETVEWKRTIREYPASEWTLQYRFRGPGTGFNVNATAVDTDFSALITAANTTTAATGRYLWQAWVTNIADTSVIRMIDEGVLIIERGFATSDVGTVDLRSTAKQILDAIDATLLGSATSDQLSYEITTPAGTRKISKMARTELIAQRKYYAEIVGRENLAERTRNGQPFAQTIVARMRRN